MSGRKAKQFNISAVLEHGDGPARMSFNKNIKAHSWDNAMTKAGDELEAVTSGGWKCVALALTLMDTPWKGGKP